MKILTKVECPKCSVPMTPAEEMSIIPSLDKNTLTALTKGFIVDVFSCPDCGLVELYHVDPQNRRRA